MKVKNFIVDRILVEEKLDIQAEYFAGVIIDDASKRPLLIFSPVGGTGVEEIARLHPEKVARQTIDVLKGFPEYEARNMLLRVGVEGAILPKLADLLTKLYKIARSSDARSAEINPLVVTADEKLVPPTAASSSTTTPCSATRNWASKSRASSTARRRAGADRLPGREGRTIAAPSTSSRWRRGPRRASATSASTAPAAAGR